MKKVSVIVPVYNGEKYIDRCLTCLTGQTLQEIEIIIINDASTDITSQLLEKWKEKAPAKINLIHLETNKGPGGARNIGLQNVSGEYVGFMDCDDIIDATMYEKLYTKAKQEDLDVVDCAYYSEAENSTVLSYSAEVVGELDVQKKSRIITGVGYSVTKIFRTKLLKENHCFFREKVIYEDLDYLINIARHSKRVGNVQEVLYRYVDNVHSATKEENEQKKFDDMLSLMKVLIQMDEEDELHQAMEFAQLSCFACAIGICLLNQENPRFILFDNLQNLKGESRNRWGDWENNPYVKQNMPKENQELIRWFAGLKL